MIDDSATWDGDELHVSPGAAARTAARDELAYLDEFVRERREPGMAEVRQQLAAIKELLTQPPAAEQVPPVVAAIVTSPLGVLIARRRDGAPPWTFIAGEQDAVKDERPEDTAVREVKEETGLRITPGRFIGQRDHPKTGRMMLYIAGTPTHGTDVFIGDEDELAEVRWVSLAEAEELMPGMFGPVREHLARELHREDHDPRQEGD